MTQDQPCSIDPDKALRVLVSLRGFDTWAVFEAMLCSIYSHSFVWGMLLTGRTNELSHNTETTVEITGSASR